MEILTNFVCQSSLTICWATNLFSCSSTGSKRCPPNSLQYSCASAAFLFSELKYKHFPSIFVGKFGWHSREVKTFFECTIRRQKFYKNKNGIFQSGYLPVKRSSCHFNKTLVSTFQNEPPDGAVFCPQTNRPIKVLEHKPSNPFSLLWFGGKVTKAIYNVNISKFLEFWYRCFIMLPFI